MGQGGVQVSHVLVSARPESRLVYKGRRFSLPHTLHSTRLRNLADFDAEEAAAAAEPAVVRKQGDRERGTQRQRLRSRLIIVAGKHPHTREANHAIIRRIGPATFAWTVIRRYSRHCLFDLRQRETNGHYKMSKHKLVVHEKS